MTRRPPSSPLVPYTPLFRSKRFAKAVALNVARQRLECGRFSAAFPMAALFALLLALSLTAADEQTHWAYRPLEKPSPPIVKSKWVRNPIDNYIAAKLDQSGLRSAPEADKRTLLRRVYFDLIGLPPTPEDFADASTLAKKAGVSMTKLGNLYRGHAHMAPV